MNNLHNFSNRMLCEYQSIFPTVASLLEHLLFVVGNGYSVDEESGMIYYDGRNREFIDQEPELTAEGWKELIEACHAKERRFADSHGSVCRKEDLKGYRIVSVSDADFTEDALYQALVNSQASSRKNDRAGLGHWLRPYPLSTSYSDIFNLNQNTPKWFLEIAVNLTKAWIRFLSEAIDKNDVWIKPSLRKEKPAANLLLDLFNSIRAEDGYDGWLENTKEKESDYADMEYTTKHRDMLVEQLAVLENLIAAK